MQKDRKSLVAWMENHPQLKPLLQHMKKLDGEDPAHDLSHLLRVALWAIHLSPESDPAEAAAAALLHDLVNLPKDHPDRAKASEYSAKEATPLLESAGFSAESIKRITGAIRDHSYSRGAKPESALGEALQDADRLEALGAIGLMRLFATGAKMKAKFFEPQDPWGLKRDLDDKKYSLDHFFTKLLRLPATFHTMAGRTEASRRAKVLEEFLDQTALELGEPRP